MDEQQYDGSNEIPQTSTQLPDFDDQSPLLSTPITPLESNSKRLRGGNFTMEEDLLIVLAWLNICLDAVHGNEQKHKTFWARIWEYFHKYKKFASERTLVSLMNHWSTMQLATNKFCGCYAQIESRHQSGINEQDKIANAKSLYQELYKGKYHFEHCWKELRYQPKWVQDCQKKRPTKNRTTSSSSVSTFTLDLRVNLGEEDILDSNFVDLERPPGRKAEKDRKKRKDKDAENDLSSSCVTLLQAMREEKKQFNEKKIEMFERQYAQEQERLSYEQKKLRLEQIKEDERIMMIDTSGMPQMLADFYVRCQMEILAKKS